MARVDRAALDRLRKGYYPQRGWRHRVHEDSRTLPNAIRGLGAPLHRTYLRSGDGPLLRGLLWTCVDGDAEWGYA